MIKAGVYGGTGYMGGEAIRILLEHPDVTLSWATSRKADNISFSHPNLYGSAIDFIHPDDITPCDIVFLALPSGLPMEIVPDLISSGHKVIDLGSDFRIKDPLVWEKIYNKTHISPELIKEAPYGIPELRREEIKGARLIANPGCFSSAAILGLAPLIKNNFIDNEKIIIDGLSGTAGAGAMLHKSIHHPEIANNIVPYNVTKHRHTYEIEQELSLLNNNKVTVHFSSAYVPIVRGILDICHVFPKNRTSLEELFSIYESFYLNEKFVRIYRLPKDKNTSWQYKPYPWVSTVAGTNYCFIGLDYDDERNRVVVYSVLDSIGKGGAHVGIQNMNIMFNLEEDTGLKRIGAHP